MRLRILFLLVLFSYITISAQEVCFTKSSSLDNVLEDFIEEDIALPMNELDMDYGYALYMTDVVINDTDSYLEVENIRDFASVYIDDIFQGTLSDGNKKLKLKVTLGKHKLSIYAENIGRITYGPEILDNNKGLFGIVTIASEEITGWKMSPLRIKETSPFSFSFDLNSNILPACYFKAEINLDDTQSSQYLDMRGWGMGEVWINGEYIGSFWESNKEKTLSIPKGVLKQGDNEIIIFELVNKGQKLARLTSNQVFE